jgi:hypothetical protein
MTKDHDFKALVRARMEATGESYVTARDQLMRQSGGETSVEPATGSSGRTFRLSSDDEGRKAMNALVDSIQTNLYDHAGIDVDDREVRIWMGEPPTFAITIPRSAIRLARAVPDSAAGGSLGAHGRRGKWLVNGATTGLVTLELDPAVRAQLHPQSAIPADIQAKVPWFVRPLVRDRSPKVRQLTVSVDDPGAFLAQLGLAR